MLQKFLKFHSALTDENCISLKVFGSRFRGASQKLEKKVAVLCCGSSNFLPIFLASCWHERSGVTRSRKSLYTSSSLFIPFFFYLPLAYILLYFIIIYFPFIFNDFQARGRERAEQECQRRQRKTTTYA